MRIVLSVFVAVLGLALPPRIGGAAPSLPPGLPASVASRVEASPLRVHFLPPSRIVWRSEAGEEARTASSSRTQPLCWWTGAAAGVEVVGRGDRGCPVRFGVELQGYVELFTPMMPDQAKLRRVQGAVRGVGVGGDVGVGRRNAGQSTMPSGTRW